MSIKDAIDLLFAARERIDFYWNFYVVVVIAVVAASLVLLLSPLLIGIVLWIRIGDGKGFVSTVEDAVRIRTGERGTDAL